MKYFYMRSKLTLSVEEKTIRRAKILAKKRKSSVSRLFSDFIDESSRMEEKMSALKAVSGVIDLPAAAEPDNEYFDHAQKKHGW
ncbi:MAG: hypothetical protein EA359_07250 [Balneolaceae bacterium]|nr:MAG: hypothetical protein EA359_07250 [Balneolaceae bacterium]